MHVDALYEAKGSYESFLPSVVVVGYGPVGKTVAHYLAKTHHVLVIDQNIDTVSAPESKRKNIQLLFGDATQLQLLERVKIESAQLVIITTPELPITHSIIEAVQQINPHADIIARVHFKSDYNSRKFGDIPIICDEEATGEKMITAIIPFIPSSSTS